MVAEREVVWVGEGECRRLWKGDPMAYLTRRVGEEQALYDKPVLMPTIGVRYIVDAKSGTFRVNFCATLIRVDDYEAVIGLYYTFDNGISIEGDPAFMPDDYYVDVDEGGPAWWLTLPA